MTTDRDTIEMLRDSVARYAAEHYGFAQRAAFLGSTNGFSAQAWSHYAGFGWLALRLPEHEGGIDADAAAIGAVMELVGERLLMEPWLASAVLGTGLVLRSANAAQQARLLPALAEGSLTLAHACEDAPGGACELRGRRLTGAKVNVLHGDVAGRLIVSAHDADAGGAPALCLVAPDAAGVQRRAYRLVDGRGAATLLFDDAPVERLEASDAAAAIAHAHDEAAVALCAEGLGVIRRLVDATCAYLKVRQQFGKPLGSNQALQHRMVDLFLLQEESRALLRAAQQAMALPMAERGRLVSGARAWIAAAARRVANEAVQMHGGVGITEELEVSHHFRRVMVINALFGGREPHLRRFTELSLASPGLALGSPC
ncbi:acyl-CoA dehydrogenase family protein [Ideonella sp. YS5]|uniref:acyl-CoA dehydrogenase family protein n=1 Tax=Ideonella sp. YS5 TaxID=3453714 RepID=UPI003EECC575